MNYFKNILPVPEFRVRTGRFNGTNAFNTRPEQYIGSSINFPANRYVRILRIVNLMGQPFSGVGTFGYGFSPHDIKPFWLGPGQGIRLFIKNQTMGTLKRISYEYQAGVVGTINWDTLWDSNTVDVAPTSGADANTRAYFIFCEEYKLPRDNS